MFKNAKSKAVSLFIAIMVIMAVVLSGCGSNSAVTTGAGTAGASTNAGTKAEDKKDVANSGKLTVYAALNEDDVVQIKKKFKEDTGIDVEYVRFAAAGEASARVQAEKASPKADALIGGSVELYGPLAKDGIFEKYTSPNAKDLDNQFQDPDGYWQGWYMGVLSIIYNSDRYTKELAPKGVKEPQTWDDLLDPHYKGLFITSNPATAGGGYIFVADQLFRLGDVKGWDYLSQLNKNVHHYTPGAGDGISLVATGQFIAGMAWAHDSVKTAKQGYPLKVVVPQDTAFEIGGSAIVKSGPNTENAKKFIDWLLTKPVQEMNRDMSNRYSVRKDVEPPQGMIQLKDVKLVNYDRPKASQMKADAVKKFTEMIGK